jgi:uncharacterized membrane protein YfcA
VTPAQIAIAVVAVMVGAIIQGSLGFGFAFVAVPVLTLLRPDALPATILFLAVPMTTTMALRERRAIDVSGFLYSTAGRVFGTAVGVALIAAVPRDSLSTLVGVFILISVGLSLLAPEVETHPRVTLAAGFTSGMMGTAAAIGGPPMALAYQSRPGSELRSTLAASFVVGTFLSLGGLAVAGRVEGWQAILALQLFPALAAGLLASRFLLRRLDRGWLRPAVLTFAALAGAAAVVRGLAG